MYCVSSIYRNKLFPFVDQKLFCEFWIIKFLTICLLGNSRAKFISLLILTKANELIGLLDENSESNVRTLFSQIALISSERQIEKIEI